MMTEFSYSVQTVPEMKSKIAIFFSESAMIEIVIFAESLLRFIFCNNYWILLD